MKMKNPTRKAQSCLLLAALISTLAALSATAATPLNARVLPRPVTPGDVTLYGLPSSTEYSGGLTNFAIGTPTYLEADINLAIPLSAITNMSWSLTTPIGSGAALTTNPLPANMPLFLPSDRLIYQVAGRMLLRPDMAGLYTVTVTIATATVTIGTNLVPGVTTNTSVGLNVGHYAGVFTCELCHSGSALAPNMYDSWTNTLHAMIFTEGINGTLSSHYNVSCIKCHTVGYDTNASALDNGGFYGVQVSNHWTFPAVLASTNFASMPFALQNLANIQCENCHGPGFEHFQSGGNSNYIDVPYTVGTCEQCHDSPPTEAYGAQWYASDHAGGFSTAATIPSGTGHDQCVQCHTSYGFITRIQNSTNTAVTSFPPTNTTYAAIGCQTCHEPHGQTLPTNDNHLIRVMASATFGDGTVITNGGEGNLCMNCHHSRNGSAVTNVANYALNLPTWAGTVSFGTHDGPQGDMLEGVNAITYGQVFPSSAHRYAVTNACVGCHMQTLASSDPGFLLAGGHTFEMSYTVVTNGVTNKIDKVAVCNQCHGQITTFNFPVEDYANTGVIQGVQTEVQILLSNLTTYLPNSKGLLDYLPKGNISPTTNWSVPQLQAAYNWQFVVEDGSYGVHNAPFATALLKASIASLSGSSVPGGLPDAWEIAYWGSITNANGAPNADPAGDGIPNWLKYSLGLSPLVKGSLATNGVIFGDVSVLGGATNTVQIYTAAEVAFNTQPGTNYWVQGVSSLSGGWQNVSPMLPGNGLPYSYLTPTRNDVQQYFRVVHNP